MNPIELQRAGQFLILPKGMDAASIIDFPTYAKPDTTHIIDRDMFGNELRRFHITEGSCDYCSRIYSHGSTQCESCGAPRREPKRRAAGQ